MPRPRTSSKKAKNALTAKTADRHDLYQRSVQAPEYEVDFLDQIHKAHTGHKAVSLREDFCGTALLCGEWLKSDPRRTATGLDIDRPTLEWGAAHNIAPLGADVAKRITLLPQDVTVPTKQKFDAICAYNYSYSVFHTREKLRAYFEAARKSLKDDGLFSLDAIGGWESQQEMTERRACEGFTYVWEQASYDPITNHFVCHISYEFKDGTKLKNAFTYDWRLWQLQELRELLLEAGFVDVDAYWEGEDEDGSGNGEFYRLDGPPENDPGWNAYLVAKKSPSAKGTPDFKRLSKKPKKPGMPW